MEIDKTPVVMCYLNEYDDDMIFFECFIRQFYPFGEPFDYLTEEKDDNHYIYVGGFKFNRFSQKFLKKVNDLISENSEKGRENYFFYVNFLDTKTVLSQKYKITSKTFIDKNRFVIEEVLEIS